MTAPLLVAEGVGVAFGRRVVLAEVDLSLASRGPFAIVGPAGGGKTTLLGLVCGTLDGQRGVDTWGELRFSHGNARAMLVAARARTVLGTAFDALVADAPGRAEMTLGEQRQWANELLFAMGASHLAERLDSPFTNLGAGERRALLILGAFASGADIVCADEPTAGLDDAEAALVLDALIRVSERRALLWVTHNQRHLRHVGGQAALLAGGRIIEDDDVRHFLESPRTRAGSEYVRTGSCSVPAPDADAVDLAPTFTPPPPLPENAQRYPAERLGPRGFRWIRKGRLAGCPMPGIVAPLAEDIEALQRVGVDVLISLTERPLRVDASCAMPLELVHFPIPDMRAPSPASALELCAHVSQLDAVGRTVAFHCKAGIGRTGTMLAAQLVFEGLPTGEAIRAVRRIEPTYIQSATQVAFLREFAALVSERRDHVIPAMPGCSTAVTSSVAAQPTSPERSDEP